MQQRLVSAPIRRLSPLCESRVVVPYLPKIGGFLGELPTTLPYLGYLRFSLLLLLLPESSQVSPFLASLGPKIRIGSIATARTNEICTLLRHWQVPRTTQ